MGFIPDNGSDPEYNRIVAATRRLCQHAQNNGQNLHLETGQESAEALIQFLDDVGTGNLFVNFDPANMILYGTGHPIEALAKLGNRVRSVHCKDAVWSSKPGITWGTEVPLGEGQVDLEAYLQTLAKIDYLGPLTIECEIAQDPGRQKTEIGRAANLLANLREKIHGNG
jgi:sugar phosphate isomerase/epimerase